VVFCHFSYCTLQTLRDSRAVSETGYSLRRAVMEDLDECATLCQEFAATSPPFTLTNVQARREAEELIRNNQLWVYEVPAHSPPSGNARRQAAAISTIVAVTRSTPTVSAITKVFTTYVCTFQSSPDLTQSNLDIIFAGLSKTRSCRSARCPCHERTSPKRSESIGSPLRWPPARCRPCL